MFTLDQKNETVKTTSKIQACKRSLNIDSRMAPEYVARQVVLAGAFERAVGALKAGLLIPALQRHVALQPVLPAVASPAVRAAVVSGNVSSAITPTPRHQSIWNKRKQILVTRPTAEHSGEMQAKCS